MRVEHGFGWLWGFSSDSRIGILLYFLIDKCVGS